MRSLTTNLDDHNGGHPPGGTDMAKRRGHGEGSISRRKDGRWEARIDLGWENGKRRRKAFYGRTRAEVAAKLTEALAEQRRGVPMVDEREQLGPWLDRWLVEIAEPRVRRSTFLSYEAIVRNHLRPMLGKQRLSKFTAETVLRYMQRKRAAGLSPRSVQFQHAVLRKPLGDAERLGLVTRNVAKLATPPSPDRREVEALSSESAREILTAVAGDRIAAIVEVALTMGMRQGEILGLAWRDVDFHRGTISVRQTLARDGQSKDGWRLDRLKTKRSRRTLAAPAATMASLRAHHARQGEERLRVGTHWRNGQLDLVFTDAWGAPLGGETITRHFQELLATAGLPRMRFHDLRHGAASIMLAAVEQPRVVMERLGHSQISTTLDIYAHVLPEQDRAVADRIGAALYVAAPTA